MPRCCASWRSGIVSGLGGGGGKPTSSGSVGPEPQAVAIARHIAPSNRCARWPWIKRDDPPDPSARRRSCTPSRCVFIRFTPSDSLRCSSASRIATCSRWSRSRDPKMLRIRRCSSVNSSRSTSRICTSTLLPDAIAIWRWNAMFTEFRTSSLARFCSASVSSRRISVRCSSVAFFTASATDCNSSGMRARMRSTSSFLETAPGIVGAREHEHFLAARHVHARAVANLHHAHRLELLERLANGRVPDAEAPRHLHDGREPVALLVIAALDHPADPAGQPIRKAFLQNRSESVSHGVLCRAIATG